jgi:hypothetical protein
MGASLSFPGTTSDYVRGTQAITAFPATICVWFKPTSFAAGTCIGGIHASGSTHGLRGGTAATTGGWVAQSIATSSRSVTTVNTATLNAWNHGASVFADPSTRRAILNGDLVNLTAESFAGGALAGIDRATIGMRDASSASLPYPGLAAHFAMWNVALTDEEVVALSKGWSPLRIRRSALKHYVPLMGAIARDLMTATSFTITGSVTSSTDGPPCQLP